MVSLSVVLGMVFLSESMLIYSQPISLESIEAADTEADADEEKCETKMEDYDTLIITPLLPPGKLQASHNYPSYLSPHLSVPKMPPEV